MNIRQLFLIIYCILASHFWQSAECGVMEDSNQAISGDDLVFLYHNDGDEFFMASSPEAIGNYSRRSRYSFVLEDEVLGLFSVRYTDPITAPYLRLLTNGSLSTTSTVASRAIFFQHPVDGNPGKFNLVENSTGDPLVTPQSSPPFKFFLKSRYPGEPLASFSVEQYILDVEESYAGIRENIIPTANLIQKLSNLNKTSAYIQLLELMAEFKHINGSDIFLVAANVIEDEAPDSPIFSLIPNQVKLLLSLEESPNQLSLTFVNVSNYPLKYHWASDVHENVLPYTFTHSKSLNRWSITYREQNQWRYTSFFSTLTQVVSSTLVFNFRLHLNADFESFQILAYYINEQQGFYHTLRATTTSPDFYFKSVNGGDIFLSPGSKFVVKEFGVKV